MAVVLDNTVANHSSVKRVIPYKFYFDLDIRDRFNPYRWICDASDGDSRYGFEPWEMRRDYHCSNSVSKVKAHADRWQSNGWEIKYYLSEPIEGKCSLSFSMTIIIVVMICNIGKCLIMFFVAFRITDKPYITIGDAVDSFLTINDPTTEGMCLISKTIKAGEGKNNNGVTDDYEEACIHEEGHKLSGTWKAGSRKYNLTISHCFYATSGPRRWPCFLL